MTRTTNGTFTEQMSMTNTFGSTNIVRIQTTGANGVNTYKVSNLSIKQV